MPPTYLDLTPPIDLDLTDKGFQKIQEFGSQLQDLPTQTIWFKNILICFLSALLREYQSLKVGLKKSTPLLAWACRNMLELNVFAKYSLLKGSNAKDFADDMWIDAIDIFSSFHAWVKLHDPANKMPELEQTIANFASEKARQGVTRKDYLRVTNMAVTVGFGEEYQRMNKVTSKLVHPTAFSVLANSDEGELGNLKPIFFNAGVRYALEAYNEIREYVARNNVEPLSC
jgi:hypothetical protein